MKLSAEEEKIQEKAINYARKNKKSIAKEFTSTEIYMPEAEPVSVFMAGSPGAGKTEASKALLSRYTNEQMVLRIDQDELRECFEDYNGDNSWLFQSAATILVDKIHDLALDQCQSFILDSTLSSYDKAKGNIKRSLKRERFVQLIYVYQDPCFAWNFVLAREKVEGRRVLKERFIDQYYAARDVVNKLKLEFGKAIEVDLLLKNIDGSDKIYKANIDAIDNHIPEKYTKIELEEALKR